jgi:hypothetical protein
VGRVLTVKGCIPGIGLRSRSSTPGAETILVNDFIDFYCSSFLRTSKLQNLAVFVEPKLDSGFPDLVIAHYTPLFAESSWTDARDGLSIEDLKVLSYLIQTGGSKGEDLISTLRLPAVRALHSLEKLLDSKWISRKDNSWKPSGMKQNFGLTKLVAIEAKISDIGKVTGQAMSNVWFASHSYALIDTSNPRPTTLASFNRLGVGLYCKGKQFRKSLPSRKRPLPSSYASLLFNEWVAKSVLRRKAI